MEKVKNYLCLVSCFGLLIFSACEEKVLFDFDEQLTLELAEIDNFLSRNSLSADILDNHARLNIINEGNGNQIQEGDTVDFLYSLYLLDCTLVQSNRAEFEPIANQLQWYTSDTLSFIAYPGAFDIPTQDWFTLGMSLSQEQSFLTLFLPSYLAFGSSRSFIIQSNTPVMADFEVLQIRR